MPMTELNDQATIPPKPKNALPHWHGFNLLEKFSTETPAKRGGTGRCRCGCGSEGFMGCHASALYLRFG